MVHFLPRYFSAQMIIRTGPNNDKAVPPLPRKTNLFVSCFSTFSSLFFPGDVTSPRVDICFAAGVTEGLLFFAKFCEPPQIFTCGITSAQHACREEHPRLGCKAAALLASVIIAWVPLRPWRSGSTLGRMDFEHPSPPLLHHSACPFLRLPNDEQGLALVPSLRHPVPAPSAS